MVGGRKPVQKIDKFKHSDHHRGGSEPTELISQIAKL